MVEPSSSSSSVKQVVEVTTIAESALSLVGDTPCIPHPDKANIYLKLEGTNATGSVADRLLLHATVEGPEIHIVASGEVCAAAALLGTVLRMPVMFDSPDDCGFVRLAEAYGGERREGIRNTIRFDTKAALEGLIEEIRLEVPDVSRVLLPASCPIRTDVSSVGNVAVEWMAAHELRDEGSDPTITLARVGLLVDPESALCVAVAEPEDGSTVVVCCFDGAMRFVKESLGGANGD